MPNITNDTIKYPANPVPDDRVAKPFAANHDPTGKTFMIHVCCEVESGGGNVNLLVFDYRLDPVPADDPFPLREQAYACLFSFGS